MTHRDVTGNQVLWIMLGIPAILGWVVIGAAWLFAPRFGLESDYLLYGLGALGVWYVLLLTLAGGTFGILALIAIIS